MGSRPVVAVVIELSDEIRSAEDWYACERKSYGRLVAGKIDKKVIRHTNGDIEAWIGCEIYYGGLLVAGKSIRNLSFTLIEFDRSGKTVK